jgi:hypothetical protein
MRRLLYLALIVWCVPILGKQYFPELIGSPYIQWPAFVILSICVPVGLWLAIRNLGKDRRAGISAVAFLLIFALSLGSNVGYVFLSGKAAHAQYVQFAGSFPPQLIAQLSKSGDQNKRLDVARQIYQTYGVVAPFKLNGGEYAAYVPTPADQVKYSEQQVKEVQVRKYMDFSKWQAEQAFYLIAIQLLAFVLVLGGLLVYDQLKFNKIRG